MPDRAIQRTSLPTVAFPRRQRGEGVWPSLAKVLSIRAWMLGPVAAFLILAILGPSLGADPTAQNLLNRLQPPVFLDGTWSHPLGTDGLGRDVLARIMEGARLSLLIGVIAASLSAIIGVLLGLLSGSIGGLLDTITTAVVELVLSVPTIVIGVVLVSTLGQSLTNLTIILVISGWIGYARVVRLQSRHLMQADFILAALALGADRRHIAFKHLLPNVFPVVIVLFFQQVAAVMLWEASLTYLGIGLPIERVSLGGMIKDGQLQIFEGWWVSAFPGLAIGLAVIGFTLLADWLQVEFDPVRGVRRSRSSGRQHR